MVVCAILAVDFNVFPRRFGKTETYGTGTVCIRVAANVGELLRDNSMGPNRWTLVLAALYLPTV